MPETLPAEVAEATPAQLRRRSRGLFAGRGGVWVIGLSVLVSLLALLPIAYVIGVSLQTGWSTVVTLVFRPRVGELLINTVLLVLLTIPLCVALGVHWRGSQVAPICPTTLVVVVGHRTARRCRVRSHIPGSACATDPRFVCRCPGLGHRPLPVPVFAGAPPCAGSTRPLKTSPNP
jgi:hypothetical protein